MTQLLRAAVTSLAEDPRAAAFVVAVAETDAPGYLDKIAEPRCIADLHSRLRDSSFDGKQRFADVPGSRRDAAVAAHGDIAPPLSLLRTDLALLWENCEAYNGAEHELSRGGRALEADIVVPRVHPLLDLAASPVLDELATAAGVSALAARLQSCRDGKLAAVVRVLRDALPATAHWDAVVTRTSRCAHVDCGQLDVGALVRLATVVYHR
jgi:hypothetical protein